MTIVTKVFIRVITQALQVPGGNQQIRVPLASGGLSDDAFHHFTPTQFMAFMNRLSTNASMVWSAACINANVSAGKMYSMYGAGSGSCDVGQVRVGPFIS